MATNFILAPGERLIQCPYNTSHHVTNDRMIRHLTKCRSAFLKGMTPEAQERVTKICRHNARHHIPYPEITYHEDNCPSANSLVKFYSHHNSADGDRQYEERRKLDEESRKRHRSPSPPHSRHRKDRHHRDRDSRDSSGNREAQRPSSSNGNERGRTEQDSYPEEEDWEADSSGHTAGYDPNLKLKSEIIIQNPSGLTKSERKVFREENRQRAVEKALESELGDRDNNDNDNTTANPDVKPDIRNLPNANVKMEPGEIQDNEEEEMEPSSSQSGGNRDNLNQHSHRSTEAPSSSSSTHRSTSHSNYGQRSAQSSGSYRPSASKSNIGSWYDNETRNSDPELDSDDYEGQDPYAFVLSKEKR